MKEIASLLGVSVVTVSKALRDEPDIGFDTRQRVLSAAESLNYKDLKFRTRKAGEPSFVIGLVVPSLVELFFGGLATALGTALRLRNYDLLIASSQDDPEVEMRELRSLVSRGVDGLIVASCQKSAAPLQVLGSLGTPFILVDRKVDGVAAPFVGVDDEGIGLLATQHLLENGYRRIAHIGGPETSTAAGRLRGYCRALKRARLNICGEYLVSSEWREDTGDISGYQSMQKLLQLAVPPDAVFCINDSVAAGAMKAILEADLQIPFDIGVIGCGNSHFADYLQVPLTSVSQDIAGLGNTAAKIAVALASPDQQSRPPRSVLLKPSLIVRGSSSGKEQRALVPAPVAQELGIRKSRYRQPA